MELQLSYVALSIALVVIIWQDLKHREIHALLPIVVFILAVVINVFSTHLDMMMCLKNIGFVVVNILGLTLYFSLKNKQVINPVDSMIGLGDILFFIAITPLFDLKNYILFFILGMVFSLILHLIVSTFKKQKTIPLAGYLSILMALYLVLVRALNINLDF